MRIGIMQGRLSPARPEGVQTFPRHTWNAEFLRASQIGLDEIEWLVDLASLNDNPLLTPQGRNSIQRLTLETGVPVGSVCVHPFVEEEFIRDTERAIAVLRQTVDAIASVGGKRVIIPAVEGGSLKARENRQLFGKILGAVLDMATARGVDIALECDLPAEQCLEFLGSFGDVPMGVCYDTGNSWLFGFDAAKELTILANRVLELHLKDRSDTGGNVPLGTGLVDFDGVVRWLEASKQDMPVILETTTGEDWQASAIRNVTFARTMLDPFLPLAAVS